MAAMCMMYGCHNERVEGTYYCWEHGPTVTTKHKPPELVESIYDHIKITIEQSAKGARVNVTYDRSDHDIETAVFDAVTAYKSTIAELKKQELKVDDYNNNKEG